MTGSATQGVEGVLRDGSTVWIRTVDESDLERLKAFLDGLSIESRLLRFFSGGIDIERTARWAVEPEQHDGYALVATTGADERIIAHASYDRDRPGADRAEAALAVADTFQGRGLGTLLLGQLAEIADGRGVDVFTAHVLPQNHRMLEVLRDAGFPLTRRTVPGEIEIEFPTALDSEGRSRFEHRERLAAAAAVRRVLEPTAVAVIGASRQRGTPGGEVFHNLITGGFAGPVYPVNTRASVVQSVAAYRSIEDVPSTVDLAVIAVPAAHVVGVAEQCAAAGVGALVVLSGGFAETNDVGRQRQHDLLAVCRRSGMRLVGPNCLGVINTDPAVRLDGQFGPTRAAPGRVGFLSQSGALGLAIIDQANVLGLGLSSFVSVGNKADLSGNDLLQYWESDPRTDVVLLYLESFGNPRKFSRIARRLMRTTPVVAVKSGRSSAGARAASSHTGALLAASDRTVDALFRQAGVIRTDTLSELFDVAKLLVSQPVPAGRRVGIVTNAGGPGILCADTCAAEGLDVVDLREATQQALRDALPAGASVGNPVDTIAAVTPDIYERAVRTVGASGDVDALIAIYIPPLAGDPMRFVAALRRAADELPKGVPLLSVFMSSVTTAPIDGVTRIPVYAFPEDAVRALANAARLGRWRCIPDEAAGEPPGLRHDEASALLAAATGESPDGRWLSPDEVARLLGCYGIPLIGGRTVTTIADAVAAAHAVGGSVALKAVAGGLVHKSDIGAVRLGLRTSQDVADAAHDIRRAVTGARYTLDGYLVQPMVDAGVELLVGVTAEPTFGPVVVCGAGGTTVELLNDVAVRITPLTRREAHDMLRELATFPLLDGYRGAPRRNVAAVEDLLLRISAIADHQPTVAEFDCNPVVVNEQGATVLDARVLARGSRGLRV
ncbi:MAG TPA: GNAT family N-acetyltransferase [Euzebyales bacterium]